MAARTPVLWRRVTQRMHPMDDYTDGQLDWQLSLETPIPAPSGPEERSARPTRDLAGAVSLRTAIIGRLDPARETSGRVWPLPELPHSGGGYRGDPPALTARLLDIPAMVVRAADVGTVVEVPDPSAPPPGIEDGCPQRVQPPLDPPERGASIVAIGDPTMTGGPAPRFGEEVGISPSSPSLLGRFRSWLRTCSRIGRSLDRESQPPPASRGEDGDT